MDLSKSGEEEGVLDNLLECLQSGSALQPARYTITQLCNCIIISEMTVPVVLVLILFLGYIEGLRLSNIAKFNIHSRFSSPCYM